MKVLCCGDREWSDRLTILRRLKQLSGEILVIHGAARGADILAGECAKELGFWVMEFPADWDKHGKSAGPIRNIQMLNEKPQLVIAFHPDLSKSRGTAHTVREAKKRGIETEVIKGPDDITP